jgi:hypothetical protein
VLGDPVGKSVLAVLDDGLASLISVVRRAGLAGSDGSIVNQLQEVLAVASDDGNLLAVLAEGVELVGVRGLNLFAGDVGELSLGDERLGLGTDQLLLKDDNLGGVGLLVLELGNLVSDLLLACWWLAFIRKGVAGSGSSYGRGSAGRRPRCYGCSSW